MDFFEVIAIEDFAKSPSESTCHSESRDNAGRRIFFLTGCKILCGVYPALKTEILRGVSLELMTSAGLRMTSAGLRMTSEEARMTIWDLLQTHLHY